MQGVILSVGRAQSLILGDDKARYTFTSLEWGNDNLRPEVGMRVDFEVRNSSAVSVYPIPDTAFMPAIHPPHAPPIQPSVTPAHTYGFPTTEPYTTTQGAVKRFEVKRWRWALAGGGALILLCIIGVVMLTSLNTSDPVSYTENVPAISEERSTGASQPRQAEIQAPTPTTNSMTSSVSVAAPLASTQPPGPTPVSLPSKLKGQTSPTDDEEASAGPPEKIELKRPTLGSRLDQLAERVESGAATAEEAAQEALIHRDGSVAVTIYLSGNVDSVVDFMEANGGEPLNVGDDYIETWTPVTLLGQIADLPGVIRTREIVPSLENHGGFTSEGADKHGSPAWNQEGYTGKGIKVGVIDFSFEAFSDLMGTELPETVEARCYTGIFIHFSSLEVCEEVGSVINRFDSNLSSHGTVVAEAIIDIAPEASLYISNPQTPGDLQKTVEWMVEEGVSVINYSRAWLYSGPGDGTSPFSDDPLGSVDRAVEGGIVWVNAVGNEGKTAWFGSFSDPDGNGYISFDESSNDEGNGLSLRKDGPVIVQLRWEDKWGGAERDFDLHIVSDDTGEIVARSEDPQNGGEGDFPLEWLPYLAGQDGQYSLKVAHRGGSEPEWIQLVASLAAVSSIERSTNEGGVNSPSESRNPGMLAVGAATWNRVDVIESYSSQGPTPDGRIKPDIVGATCGISALTLKFCGTSQASPHVAGLAALVRQRFPEFGPEEVVDYLKENAEQKIGNQPNNIFGHGFAKLPESANIVPVATATAPAQSSTPKSAPDLGDQPFSLEWETSDADAELGGSFTLTVRMYDVQQSGEHGGISVSFPSLDEPGGSRERHSSPDAVVEVLDYTSGLSEVTFHQPGTMIYHRDNNRQFPAEYLLVESDDPTWSRSDDRTLRLRITPKLVGSFPVQIRGWICADEYTDCSRRPESEVVKDQQGWVVERTELEIDMLSHDFDEETVASPSGNSFDAASVLARFSTADPAEGEARAGAAGRIVALYRSGDADINHVLDLLHTMAPELSIEERRRAWDQLELLSKDDEWDELEAASAVFYLGSIITGDEPNPEERVEAAFQMVALYEAGELDPETALDLMDAIAPDLSINERRQAATALARLSTDDDWDDADRMEAASEVFRLVTGVPLNAEQRLGAAVDLAGVGVRVFSAEDQFDDRDVDAVAEIIKLSLSGELTNETLRDILESGN